MALDSRTVKIYTCCKGDIDDTDTGLAWREVAEIPDPLDRIRQIDAEVAYAKQLRGVAVLQLYADYGATEAVECSI